MWVTLKYGVMVNMDHASKVVRKAKGGFIVLGLDGEKLGETLDENFEEFLEPLVPATSGQEVVVLTWYSEVGSDIDVERRLVVAWRINTCGAYPVLAGDEIAANQLYLIPMPDGKYDEPFVATHASLDEAVAYCRHRHPSA